MPSYLLRRLIQSALILLGVAFITFFLLYVLPADPVRQIAGRSATPETVANIRRELGLDQPFIVQFLRYLIGLLHGDFGRRPVVYRDDDDLLSLLSTQVIPAIDSRLIEIKKRRDEFEASILRIKR